MDIRNVDQDMPSFKLIWGKVIDKLLLSQIGYIDLSNSAR